MKELGPYPISIIKADCKMDNQNKFNTNDFAEYLQSMVKLDELQKMTDTLDQELKDSQYVLNEIKTVFDTLPTAVNTQQTNSGKDISQCLAADVPRLLLSDMTENTYDIDLDNLIATMKNYVEDLKKNYTVTEPKEAHVQRSLDNLDLTSYATSLDQLAKRIEKMKLHSTQGTDRNDELEQKLNQLCQDVNLFSQMVEAKTKLSESNKNWVPVQQENTAMFYDNMITKLLSGINEVTFLLKNKN